MVHVAMSDENIADAQELAGRDTGEITEIKKQRASLEYEVHVEPWIVELIIDEHRIKMARHSHFESM